MEEERRGMTVKDLLIRLVLIVVFILLLLWLFPMPDLKPLNNQIFADNLDRMKQVAKSYYTVERLPKDLNSSKRMTLKEMIDNHYILPLMDSNGNYCSEDDSYVEITKKENEYIIKVYLSCSDKQDYIIEHFGCYDICSDQCKVLETTTNNGGGFGNTTNVTKVTTSGNKGKLYEYQFSKYVCEEKFDKYVCPSGYYLVGDKCIKDGSKVETIPAHEKIINISSTDTKDAKAIIDSNTEIVPASCKDSEKTTTIDANKSNTVVDANKVNKEQTITADKINKYDVKGAAYKTVTTNSNYIIVQNYDIIWADKIVTSYKWEYTATLNSLNPGLAFENDSEKLVYIRQWEELDCLTCVSTHTVYQYFRYKKKVEDYKYSCAAYPGYTSYDTDKCRKPTTTTKECPPGFSPNGNVCTKKETTYNCDRYGSDYKLDLEKKTCTKTTTTYKCPSGSTPTSDERHCKRTVTSYECPAGTTSIGNNKCQKPTYSCPPNTSDTSYTLSGTKCIAKTKVKVCTCPDGTDETDDPTKCAKTTSTTRYTCEDYPGYTLQDKKCTKTTTTQEKSYYCTDDYTLNGTSCVRTVNVRDTINAEKSYNLSCDTQYKWSTSTSIPGWVYTGNKREIY